MTSLPKYDALEINDAMLFAVAKTEALLRSINGEARIAAFGGAEDIPWMRQTCDEIIALLEKASEMAPFK